MPEGGAAGRLREPLLLVRDWPRARGGVQLRGVFLARVFRRRLQRPDGRVAGRGFARANARRDAAQWIIAHAHRPMYCAEREAGTGRCGWEFEAARLGARGTRRRLQKRAMRRRRRDDVQDLRRRLRPARTGAEKNDQYERDAVAHGGAALRTRRGPRVLRACARLRAVLPDVRPRRHLRRRVLVRYVRRSESHRARHHGRAGTRRCARPGPRSPGARARRRGARSSRGTRPGWGKRGPRSRASSSRTPRRWCGNSSAPTTFSRTRASREADRLVRDSQNVPSAPFV